MDKFYSRTELLIGTKAIEKLKNAKVLLFGLGGVGGQVFDTFVRAGIEHIDVVDNDTFSITNLNRQTLSNLTNIGKKKTDVAKEHALNINPQAQINCYNMFFLPENADTIDFSKYDYVIDAIDTVTAKMEIIKKCNKLNIPLISCMGTGNRLDATKFVIDDIYNTHTCKVAKVIRKLCKEANISSLTVLYSTISPANTHIDGDGRHAPASIAYTPAVAGLLISQYVIRQLIKD